MKATDNMNRAGAIEQHLASRQGWIREAITMALKRNEWKSTLVAIPLALAPSAANDFASANQFSIRTAEQVISGRLEEIEGQGLIIYEYFPTGMTDDENKLFIARLRAYRDLMDRVVLLFILLTQDAPTPEPSILRSAWATGMFKKGQVYEIVSCWHKVTLRCLNLVDLLLVRWWRRKRLISNPDDHYTFGRCNRLEKATCCRTKIQRFIGFDMSHSRKESASMFLKKWFSHLHLAISGAIVLLLSVTGATTPAFAAQNTASDPPAQFYCIGTTPPPGEVITEEEYNSAYSQCQPTSFAGANVELVVPGPRNGQSMQVCPDSPIPANDVVTADEWPLPSRSYSLSLCNFHTYTVTPAIGTTMLICQISHIPVGYTQDGPPFTLSSYCPDVPVVTSGKFGVTNTIRIHKITPVEPTRSVQ
jgi:hypothetical protein